MKKQANKSKILHTSLISILYLSVVFIFAACSSGEENNSVSAVTGTFVDDPVQGLNYECSSGTSGITNAKGEYTCNEGNNVTFSIGTLKLGVVPARSDMTTPYTLFPNNENSAINVARLLQSLNTGSTTGIIELNASQVANIQADSDFTSSTFITDMEQDLGIKLVSANQAKKVMHAQLIKYGSSTLLSGVVADGSIFGAKVCLDVNINNTCDTNEPTTTTNKDGTFSLNVLSVHDSYLKPIIAVGGFDTTTNMFYKGELKTIVSSLTSSIVISPITDLIATSYLELKTKNINVLGEVKATITNTLSIDRINLYDNPMQEKILFQKMQQLNNAKQLIEMGTLNQLENWSSPHIDFTQREDLRKNIKLQLANESNFIQNDFSTSLTNIVEKQDMNISQNEKAFITKQLRVLNDTLNELPSSQIDTAKLVFLHAGIHTILDKIYTGFESNSSSMTIVSIPSLEALISNAEQNTTECIKALTYAINPDTGISEKFSTPCEVPTGWIISTMDGFYYGTDGWAYKNRTNYLNQNNLNIGDIVGAHCSAEINSSIVTSTTCVDSDYTDKYQLIEYVLPIEMLRSIDWKTNKQLPYELLPYELMVDSNESFGMLLSDLYWVDKDGNRMTPIVPTYHGQQLTLINNNSSVYYQPTLVYEYKYVDKYKK